MPQIDDAAADTVRRALRDASRWYLHPAWHHWMAAWLRGEDRSLASAGHAAQHAARDVGGLEDGSPAWWAAAAATYAALAAMHYAQIVALPRDAAFVHPASASTEALQAASIAEERGTRGSS